MPLTKEQHLDPKAGPKRILSLDGGGIRGILTLEFLKAVESLIKARFGEKTLLCDYFDLIGGTSTGSIIAAGLACGMTVDALQALYRNIGASVFQPGGSVGSCRSRCRESSRPSFLPDRSRPSSTGSSARRRRSTAPRFGLAS